MGRWEMHQSKTTSLPKLEVLLRANGVGSLSQLWPPSVRRGGLSLLEYLPNELLQAIYVFSLYGNGRWLLSLPRASHYLGRALSTEAIYVEVLLAGFSGYQLYTPPDFFRQIQSYNNLPEKLLGLPWFSSRVIRAAHIRHFTRMAMTHYCPSTGQMKKQHYQSIAKEIRRAIEDNEGNCGAQSPTIYSVGGESFLTLRIRTQPMELTVYKHLPRKSHRGCWFFRSFMEGMGTTRTPIPRKFLCPPWTEEKCFVLEDLLVNGAELAPADRDYAVAGLEDAVRIGNLRAVTALLSRLEPINPRAWPGDQFGCFSNSEKGHSCNILCSRRKSWSLGLGVTRELLRIAILEAPFDARIVNCLLHAECHSSLGRKDALWNNDLLEWATGKSIKGDEVGSWVLSTIVDPGLQ